jgi:hypothetical protein
MKILPAFRKTVTNSLKLKAASNNRMSLSIFFVFSSVYLSHTEKNVHVIAALGTVFRATGGFRNNFMIICDFLNAATSFLKRVTERNFKLDKWSKQRKN